MVLDNYIKQDFIKKEFMKSCLIVSDIQQAESIAKTLDVIGGNIIFCTSYIKFAFYNKLKMYHNNIKIINCDSSKTRLINDIRNCNDCIIVFDKVNYCMDISIFNMINKMDRILVC